MQGERTIGGLRCSEVLADLTEYLDGRLDAETRMRIEAHVGGCTNCERFGGSFGKVVAAIRAKLATGTASPGSSTPSNEPTSVDDAELAARLIARLGPQLREGE